jgi:hypothetical protein
MRAGGASTPPARQASPLVTATLGGSRSVRPSHVTFITLILAATVGTACTVDREAGEAQRIPLHIQVTNASSPHQVWLKIEIDDTLVVDGPFYVGNQHNVTHVRTELPPGKHKIEVFRFRSELMAGRVLELTNETWVYISHRHEHRKGKAPYVRIEVANSPFVIY